MKKLLTSDPAYSYKRSLNLKSFQGPHCEEMWSRGPHKIQTWCPRATFLHQSDKKLVILGYFLILKVVECRTYHVGEPHAAHEMPV